MLDGLDLVRWEDLETAGTSDEDIPGLLRAIATATDDKAALDSFGELSWTSCIRARSTHRPRRRYGSWPVVHAFVDPIDPNLVWGSQADAVILGVEMGRPEFVATLTHVISIHERPFRQRCGPTAPSGGSLATSATSSPRS